MAWGNKRGMAWENRGDVDKQHVGEGEDDSQGKFYKESALPNAHEGNVEKDGDSRDGTPST